MAKKKNLLTPVRRRLDRLADSPALMNAAAGFFASRIRVWHARTNWHIEGQEELAAEMEAGRPVIMAVWHGRLAMTPFMWRQEWGPVCSLTSRARPGRLVAGTLSRFGWANAGMHDRKSNREVSMQVARMLRGGTSIGIACDGPLGPARHMKTVPLDWARVSGAPIWLWTYSMERFWRLDTWDRMLVPKSGGRGVMLYQKWGHEVPKRLDADGMGHLRAQLETDLTALTLAADMSVGHRDLIC